jgi:ribonuclease R
LDVAIAPHDVRRILTEAQRPVGVKELLRLGGYHPGEQTDLKRALRDLLRTGEVEKDGKRFRVPRALARPRAPEAPGPAARRGDAPRGAAPGASKAGPKAPRPRGSQAPEPWTLRGLAARGRAGREEAGAEAPVAGPPGRSVRGARAETRPAAAASRGKAGMGAKAGARGPRLPPAEFGGRGARRAQAVPRGRPEPREWDRRGGGRGGGRGWDEEADGGRGRPGPRGGAAAGGEELEGVLHLHRDGYGFVHPMDGKGENVFLPAFEAQRALDKDVVRVTVRGPEGRREGRLVDLVERRRQLVVGTYRHRGKKSYVEPQDARLGDAVHVPPTQLARDGDVVKVRLGVGTGLMDEPGALHGEVAGSLGRPGHPSAEVLSLVFAQGFSDEFPPEVMDEADAIALEVPEHEWQGEGRLDLRKLPLVTIDGEDARDFDDAVYAEPHPRGWRLVVAIADVTHYVREGTALDDEALRRATSVYLPDRVLPMLPERLSNGICSLRPDEDRMCMVADVVLDRAGKRVASDIYPAVMRSAARCTYNEVQAVLDGEDVPHRNAFLGHFERLAMVARLLRKVRAARGAIDFDLPETKVVVGEDGFPERVERRERLFSHRLIEECMLAANEAVASFCNELGLPTVYRFHGEPDEDKLRTFMALAGAHGFTIGKGGKGGRDGEEPPTSAELNAFVQSLEGHPEQRTLNQLLLRSMMQAVYSSENVGHYGLAAEFYLHFTSPIRRYPDLLVHRLLKAHWARKGKRRSEGQLEAETERLEAMAVHCSERERAAMQSEREVSQFLVCVLMRDRVGEEFDATVSSVADFGFFAELGDENVEGVVQASSVGAGGRVDPLLHALVFPNGRRVRVGDPVRVRLAGINPERRQLELEVLAWGQRGAAPAAAAPAEEEALQPGVRRRRKVAEPEPVAARGAPKKGKRGAKGGDEAPAAAEPLRRRKAAPPVAPLDEEVDAEDGGADDEGPVVPEGYAPSRQVMRKRGAPVRTGAPTPVRSVEVEPPARRKDRREEQAPAEAPARAAGSPLDRLRAGRGASRRADPDAELRVGREEALRAQGEGETPENYGARPAFQIPGMAPAPADSYGARPAFVIPGMEPAPEPSGGSAHPGFDRLRSLASHAGRDDARGAGPARKSYGGERGGKAGPKGGGKAKSGPKGGKGGRKR